jgi:hypothetical protein
VYHGIVLSLFYMPDQNVRVEGLWAAETAAEGSVTLLPSPSAGLSVPCQLDHETEFRFEGLL